MSQKNSFIIHLFEISQIYKANLWMSETYEISENHICASHNIPIMFYRITNREGDQVSLFTRSFSHLIISLRKGLKEFHNIVVSHLLTSAVHRVIAVECETERKLSSLTDHAKRRKQHCE